MNFDTPAKLYKWYYDHLYAHVAQVRAKGFVCRDWLEKGGPWAEDFRSLAHNMQFTMKGGRTLLRLAEELMNKAGWKYKKHQFPPEPVYANSIALSDFLPKKCANAPIIETDFFNIEEQNAFHAVYWGYINDGRAAIAFMRYVQSIIDANDWGHDLPIDMMEFHVNDVMSRVQWGWRCTESNYLSGLATHNIAHDRDQVEMQAKRPVKVMAKDLSPDRQLSPECRANVIVL